MKADCRNIRFIKLKTVEWRLWSCYNYSPAKCDACLLMKDYSLLKKQERLNDVLVYKKRMLYLQGEVLLCE